MQDWDEEDVQKWKLDAKHEQQIYSNRLSDRRWDLIKYKEWQILQRKVAYGVYGEPSHFPSIDDDQDIGYTEEQMVHVNKICNKIHEEGRHHVDVDSEDIWFSCAFVCGKINDERFTVPVFKILKGYIDDDDSPSTFIDTDCRVYEGWTDYLKSNTLPKCLYCYPMDGIYSNSDGEVVVDFGESPACSVTHRAFSFLDWAATAVTLVATGVGIVATCAIPMAGPVAAAAEIVEAAGIYAGYYEAARSGYTLVDRSLHDQSIGLGDEEGRNCWLGLVGGGLSFAQIKMTSLVSASAREGFVMSTAGRITHLTVNICSVSVNGLGIINSAAVLIDKAKLGQLNSLDVAQFSASLLFFSHSLIDFKTASGLIKDIQRDVINNHRNTLEADHQAMFDKLTSDITANRDMHETAKVVRAVNKMENTADFYKSVGSMHEEHNFDDHVIKLTEHGLVEINREFIVHPEKFMQIKEESRQQILQETKDLSSGNISEESFKERVKTICRTNRVQFECQRMETVRTLCEIFSVDSVKNIRIGNEEIFSNLRPFEIDRITGVMANTANHKPDIIKIATDFAASRGCSSVGEFCAYVEFTAHNIYQERNTYMQDYRNNKNNYPEVTGKPKVFFENEVYKNYGDEGSGFKSDFLDRLNRDFNHNMEQVHDLNENATPGFTNTVLAAYHYVKHKSWGSEDLTPHQYFAIADEAISANVRPQDKLLSQEGDARSVTYLTPVNGAKVVTIERNGNVILATVMYDRILRKSYEQSQNESNK